jgi:transposase-like protein
LLGIERMARKRPAWAAWPAERGVPRWAKWAHHRCPRRGSVGIFAEEIVTTDTLGRRTGPRMRHTIEEKLQIFEETRAKGASVATAARRRHVNPNKVFAWTQLYRPGFLKPQGAKGDAKMLPVKVSTPTVIPTERAESAAVSQSHSQPKHVSRLIEIRLRNGQQHCDARPFEPSNHIAFSISGSTQVLSNSGFSGP